MTGTVRAIGRWQILALISVALGLAALYLSSRAPNSVAMHEFRDRLQQIRHLETRLGNEVLESRAGELTSYDPIVAAAAKLEARIAELGAPRRKRNQRSWSGCAGYAPREPSGISGAREQGTLRAQPTSSGSALTAPRIRAERALHLDERAPGINPSGRSTRDAMAWPARYVALAAVAAANSVSLKQRAAYTLSPAWRA